MTAMPNQYSAGGPGGRTARSHIKGVGSHAAAKPPASAPTLQRKAAQQQRSNQATNAAATKRAKKG